ncbi:MAG: glycogen/starch synthase [Kiritimatiellia bacterium]
MNILFFTNTYLPHVGGVAKSVHTLETTFRRMGHEVRIVAPEFEDAAEDPNVLRVPAIQKFNGSDFSVRIPIPNVEDFYSGIPSTTPAVQAEIFYGQRTAVPAFHFLQRETGRPVKM